MLIGACLCSLRFLHSQHMCTAAKPDWILLLPRLSTAVQIEQQSKAKKICASSNLVWLVLTQDQEIAQPHMTTHGRGNWLLAWVHFKGDRTNKYWLQDF